MTLQTDPSWIVERLGSLSASRFKDAIDILKSGKESEKRRRYRSELVAERIEGYAVDHYVTPAMSRGLRLEAPARDLYEEVTGHLLPPARLYFHPTIPMLCATPDSVLGTDTVVEFKCPLVSTYIDWLEGGTIPDEHLPQLVCQLLVTGRKKAIFVAYCPEMPEAKRLFIRDFEPTPEALKLAEEAAVKFLQEVDELFDRVTATEEKEPT